MSNLEDSLSIRTINTDLEMKRIEYDPNGQPNSQRAIDVAANDGLVVRFPAANELFIDIDNTHSLMLFCKQMDILRKYVGVQRLGNQTYWHMTPSKSGDPKYHVVVTLEKDVTEIERVALQAMLGSDRVRELLGYVQAKNGDPHPTLFLEKQ